MMDDNNMATSDLGGNAEVPSSDVSGNIGSPVSIIPDDKIQKAVSEYLEENPIHDGEDGITPTIGENGNWYLGDNDTGKPSRGNDGPQGEQGPKGDNGEAGADGKSAYAYAQDGGYTGT